MAFLSRSVFEHRFSMMKDFMHQHHLDALLFSSEDFVTFATNYSLDVRVFERPAVAVVKKDATIFAFLNQLSRNHFRMSEERNQNWIDDVLFYDEFPGGVNEGRILTNWPEVFSTMLETHQLHKSRIGVQSQGKLLQTVNQSLSDLEFVNVGEDMKLLRAVKHEEEIELMTKACELSDWMQERYIENIRPGKIVQALDAEMHAVGFQKAQEMFNGDELVFRGYTLSGPTSASPHGNGARTGQMIRVGDGIVNIVIPVINGLVVENERTYFCGEPNDTQKEAYSVALAANKAAVNKIKLGNRVCDIENAARETIIAGNFGENLCHRTGHGLGYLGHEWPVDMAFEDRMLMKNEVYSAEPGIYIHGLGGFRADDTVVVDETPKVLTRSPKELEDIIIKC